MNAIEVTHLVKSYKEIKAVNDLSFHVKEGIIFGMLGPNGAGKTTTIECIIGLNERNEGSIKVLGLDPRDDSRNLYQQIGVQLQETAYQDKIRVYELCELFTALYDDPLDYKKLLERFHLDNQIKKYIQTLSGGQKQKIAIILALIANPKILFLDELTTGLDPKSRRDMWQVIKELKEEQRTIFMTTHYMEEAAYLCDEICIIDEGRIVAMGTVDEVIENADIDIIYSFEIKDDITDLLKQNIKGINKIDRIEQKIDIYTKSETLLTEIILFLKEQKMMYQKFTIKRPDLEDAYLKLTGKVWKEQSL